MKQSFSDTKTESFGAVDSKKMTIAANAKAFRILVDNIYMKKERAVVAEISQNAHDAHLAGAISKSFHVTLPTQFDSTFIVRDFGPGMSHDFMMGSYSMVFESTKDQSNIENGAFGLGRLAPLSVCNSYTVTCFDGAAKRIYTVSLDSGIPEIIYMGEFEDSSERGVEVRVGIERGNISYFHNAAREIYKHYPQKPEILNKKDLFIDIRDVEYGIKREENGKLIWGIPEEKQGRSIAMMGLYPYPIENTGEFKNGEVLNKGLFIQFEIGDLDITPNRESLQYTELTKKSIQAKIDDIVTHIKSTIEREISQEPSYYEACQKYAELGLNSYKKFLEATNQDRSIGFVVGAKRLNISDHIGFSYLRNLGYPFLLQTRTRKKTGYYSSSLNDNFRYVGSSEQNIHFRKQSTICYVGDREKKYHWNKICDYLKEEAKNAGITLDTVYFVSFDPGRLDKDLDEQKLKRELGFYNIQSIDDVAAKVPKTPKKKAVRSEYKKCLKLGKNGNYEDCFRECEVDLTNGNFVFSDIDNCQLPKKVRNFVNLGHHFQIKKGGKLLGFGRCENNLSNLVDIIQKEDKELYFVKRCNVEKIKKENPEAVYILDYIIGLKHSWSQKDAEIAEFYNQFTKKTEKIDKLIIESGVLNGFNLFKPVNYDLLSAKISFAKAIGQVKFPDVKKRVDDFIARFKKECIDKIPLYPYIDKNITLASRFKHDLQLWVK